MPLPDAEVKVPVVCVEHLLLQPVCSVGSAGSGQQVAGHLDWPRGTWWWGHRRLMGVICCSWVVLLSSRHGCRTFEQQERCLQLVLPTPYEYATPRVDGELVDGQQGKSNTTVQ